MPWPRRCAGYVYLYFVKNVLLMEQMLEMMVIIALVAWARCDGEPSPHCACVRCPCARARRRRLEALPRRSGTWRGPSGRCAGVVGACRVRRLGVVLGSSPPLLIILRVHRRSRRKYHQMAKTRGTLRPCTWRTHALGARDRGKHPRHNT